MANEKRLIYLEDAIEKIVNFPSKVAQDAFYSKKQFTPMQMLTVVADRQHEIIDLLKQVKEVDAVEVVHGRWIHPKGYVVSNSFFCSVCNHEEVSLHVIHPLPGGGCKADEHGNFYYPPKMNYCPNCGARMDGDGNA